jgi:hypothetical protein
MCFSAEADFVGGAVIGVVGIATLAEVHTKRELPLAALPLAFAVHQLTEGFVWLGLEGGIARSWGDVATHLYLLYAWAVLPLLVPLAVALVEPDLRKRRWMLGLTAVGGAVGAYLLAAMTQTDISARIVGHTIHYQGAGNLGDAVTVLYVTVTCGAFLLSSHRRIVWFGFANLLAVVAVGWYQAAALTSLWCVWGAIASILIYFHFAEHGRLSSRFRHLEAVPEGRSQIESPSP